MTDLREAVARAIQTSRRCSGSMFRDRQLCLYHCACRQAADAALSAIAEAGYVVVPRGDAYRHLARGSTYHVVGIAGLQCAEPCDETANLMIYRGEDGQLWARPYDEFHDGRFELLAASQTEGGK